MCEVRQLLGVGSFLLLHGFQGPSSGCRTGKQVSLPTEHLSESFFFLIYNWEEQVHLCKGLHHWPSLIIRYFKYRTDRIWRKDNTSDYLQGSHNITGTHLVCAHKWCCLFVGQFALNSRSSCRIEYPGELGFFLGAILLPVVLGWLISVNSILSLRIWKRITLYPVYKCSRSKWLYIKKIWDKTGSR